MRPLVRIVWDVTEPFLGPLRRILPSVGMFDFSPMVALIIVYLLQSAIARYVP